MIVFIAIELENGLKNKIYNYTGKNIKPFCSGGRWVRKDNYHITLKYIGETGEQNIIPLCDVLNEVSCNAEKFILKTGYPGVFGKGEDAKARVLWLGATGGIKRLGELKDTIEEKTCDLGYMRDNRFSPHITLARDVLLKKELLHITSLSQDIPVNAISLMESRVERGRRVYLPLSVHRFK